MSITGSTGAGIRVAEAAARTVKKVTLELGGKSAFLLLDDTDLAQALPIAVRQCFVNNGQTCAALTRLIVPRAMLGDVETASPTSSAGCASATRSTRRPSSDRWSAPASATPCAATSRRASARARGWSPAASRRRTGSSAATTSVRPCSPTSSRTWSIAREEIFGPVLVVLAADGDDDAVRIANDSDYGLSGGVWSSDRDRAIAVAKRLRTGQVGVNGGRFNVRAPFGGFKQSGVGRELGEHGLAEYFELTSLQLPA